MSAIDIQVVFSCPNLFYFVEEPITGCASLQSTDKKLKLKKRFLEFVGKLGYITDCKEYTNCSTRHIQLDDIVYRDKSLMIILIPIIQPQYDQVK